MTEEQKPSKWGGLILPLVLIGLIVVIVLIDALRS
jgi:hypothetical protein